MEVREKPNPEIAAFPLCQDSLVWSVGFTGVSDEPARFYDRYQKR